MGSRGVLNKRQQSILVGLLLGDGFLEWRYKYPRLRVDHSLKQKEYVDWLYKEFKKFCNQKPRHIDRFDVRVGNIHKHYLFSTKISQAFLKYRKIFYKGRKKIIPQKLSSYLNNELSLAVWYMDDGFRRTDCKAVYLCTSGYSIKEQNFLQIILKERYGLETKIYFARKNARIYFPASSAKRFCDLIRPYVLPLF